MRDARREAFQRLGGGYDVRVLEPSPPAVAEGPWFADDPVDASPSGNGNLPIVSPVSGTGVLWEDVIEDDPGLAAWASARWLGAYKSLEPVPATLVETRLALHKLADEVISPAREKANGKIALRWTLGGFGTPFFGDNEQMRVEGDQLIHTTRGGEQHQKLDVDAEVGHFLGDWYGFTTSVLEELRAGAPDREPSRVQLWPEHFDIATELGSEEAGERAGYGGSPGDELHPEPYLYVVPWTPERADGELWDSTAFKGAELPYAELLEAEDQREAALDFFRARLL